MGAVYLISKGTPPTTVLRNIKIRQDNNDWIIELVDSPPPSTTGVTTRLNIINFYFECADSSDLCSIKDWMKGLAKKIAPATLDDISKMVTS